MPRTPSMDPQRLQAQYAAQYNPSGVPVPGPGTYVGPYYQTQDGRWYRTPGSPEGGGRFVPSEPPPDGFSTLPPIPPPQVNPTPGPNFNIPTPRQPWTSGGNTVPNWNPTGGTNMPAPPNNAGGGGADWQQWLIPALAGLAPILMNQFAGGGGGGNNPTASGSLAGINGLVPDMQAMFQHQMARQRALDPLFSDVVGMTQRRLPTWARGSGPGVSAMSSTAPAAMPSGGTTMPAPNPADLGANKLARLNAGKTPEVLGPNKLARLNAGKSTAPAEPAPAAPVDLQALVKMLQSLRASGFGQNYGGFV